MAQEKRRNAERERAARGLSGFHTWFWHAGKRASEAVGSAWAFVLALVLIFVWVLTGPIFGFSDTWQLVINTATTVITFLMVFLIQNTQNREAKATQLKLDELIRAVAKARNEFIGAEADPEEQLERELKDVEAERNKTSAEPRQGRSARDGRPDNGEPAGHR